MNNKQVKYLTESAMIAALYACLVYAGEIFNLSYGPVQLRFAEALTILPIFSSAAIPGLTIGCFISNLISPFGILDIVLGTIATFLAAIFSYKFKNCTIKKFPLLSIMCPFVFNVLIVPISMALTADESDFVLNYFLKLVEFAPGQFISAVVLGSILWKIITKRKLYGSK